MLLIVHGDHIKIDVMIDEHWTLTAQLEHLVMVMLMMVMLMMVSSYADDGADAWRPQMIDGMVTQQ